MGENQIEGILLWAKKHKELDAEIEKLQKRIQSILDAHDLRITKEIVEG